MISKPVSKICVWAFLLSVVTFQSAWAQGIPVIGRISIEDGAESTSSKDGRVMLKIFARNAAEMRISNNASWIGARWEPYQQRKRWKLDAREDGLKTVYAQFRNKDKTILSDVSRAQIELDRAPPEAGTVTINFGVEYTTDRKVTVEVQAEGAAEMQISNRADFMRARWYPYRSMIKNWLIGGLDGKHKVYARFRDRAGNVSPVASDTITLDRQPPSVSRLRINNDSVYTRTQGVNLQIAARDATEMEILNIEEDGAAGATSGWIPYSEEYRHTLTPGNGKKIVAVRFKDKTGNISRPTSDYIIFDNIPPSATRVRINRGNRYTNRNEVSLQFAAVKASEMMISNDPDFDGAEWVPYRPYFPVWVIDHKTQGKKTVYVKFKDKAGNVSEPVSDDIIYDSIEPGSPSIEIVTKEGQKTKRGYKITNQKEGLVDLKLYAEDARYMMLSNSSTFFDARWDIYRTEYKDWELEHGEGKDFERTVYVKFRDKAGNISSLKYDKVIYDITPPVDGRVSIKDYDAKYVRTDTTQLRLFARGADQIKIANEDSSKLEEVEWEPYVQVRENWILDSREGTKTVYVQFKDYAGNVSGITSGKIYLDKTPPQEPSLVINRGDTITNEPNKVVYVEARAEGAADMRISSSPSFRSTPWRFYDPKMSKYPLSGEDGLKTLYAQFRDSAGNVSEMVTDQILLDRRPPMIGKVEIQDGNKGTRFQKVTITLEADDAVEMKVSNNPYLEDAKWEPYVEKKDWTLLGEDGIKTVYVQFRDKIGNISRIAYDRIGKDTSPPTDGEIVIDRKKKKYVTDINKYVRLYLSSKGATVMKIANSKRGLDSVDWRPYKYIIEDWILAGEDGEKEVWAMFQDEVGNRTKPISKKIILDRQPPYNEELLINSGARYTNKREVKLQLGAEEATKMRISHSRSFPPPAKWEPYAKTKNWVLVGREGRKFVHVQFADDAGNVSYTTTAAIMLDMTPPSPGYIKIDNGSPFTTRNEVRLEFHARDADYMMVSNDPNFEGATWREYKRVINNWPLNSGKGYRRVYAKFKDKFQNVSPSIFSEVTVE